MLFTWETAIIATVGYYLVIHLYRLFFHPLAKFPGPRIAAASFWYEFYYDVVRCGRYHIKIAELHEKYGQFGVETLMPSSKITDNHRPNCTDQSRGNPCS